MRETTKLLLAILLAAVYIAGRALSAYPVISNLLIAVYIAVPIILIIKVKTRLERSQVIKV